MNQEYIIEKNAFATMIADMTADITRALAEPGGVQNIVEMAGGVRVYTCESREPAKNRNGGSYDYYTDYTIGWDGNIWRIEDWSAEFDYAEWNGFSDAVYGIGTAEGLNRLADRLVAKLAS